MDAELELLNNKTNGRSSTLSVKLHQPKGDRSAALRNSPMDGNEFLPDVAEAGASAAIVSDPTRAMNSPSDLALLQVQDTLTALHKLAPGYRQLMPQRPKSSSLPITSGTITTEWQLQPNWSLTNSFAGGRQSLHGAVEREGRMFDGSLVSSIIAAVILPCVFLGLLLFSLLLSCG